MTENRKISELTEVTSLGDDAEFVLVTYGGSQGPEPTPPTATIIGMPSTPIMPTTPVGPLTIGGEGVTHYKFKFHGETVWSEEKSAAADKIWFPQPPSDFGWPVGYSITVIGRDAQANWQPESEPTIAVWTVLPLPWKVQSMMVSKLGYAIGDIDPNTSWGSAFDGDISDPTGGAWKCTPMGWIGQDFGSTKYAIGKYRILARNNGNGGQNRWVDPKNWVFEASNDNFATTVVLDEQSNQTFTQGNWNEYEIPNQLTSPPDKYQYYRLNVTENNGHQAFLIIQEIEMIAYSAEPFPTPTPTPIDVTSDESFYLKYPDLYDGRYHGMYEKEGEFIPAGQQTLGTSKYQWWKGPIPPVVPGHAPYQFIVRMHTNQVQWEFCYLHIPGNGITGGMNQYAYSGNAAAPFKWPWEVEWFETSTGNALGNFISDEPWPITFDSLINTYANISGSLKVDETPGTDYILGNIVYVDLEGGFYGIEEQMASATDTTSNVPKYLPINIQAELAGNEGKEIKITEAWSKLNDDGLVGIWQWGKLIFADEYEIVELTPEWTESDICNVIDVAGLTSSLARFNGVYDYYPRSTLTGRPFWVKNGIYNSDGTLDWDGTQTASLQAGSSSTIGFIYWIESTTGDSWWAIWSAHIGSAEFTPSSGSHCDVCTATSSNHSMKLPYDDDGPGGFGSAVTLTSANCYGDGNDTSIPTQPGPAVPV